MGNMIPDYPVLFFHTYEICHAWLFMFVYYMESQNAKKMANLMLSYLGNYDLQDLEP